MKSRDLLTIASMLMPMGQPSRLYMPIKPKARHKTKARKAKAAQRKARKVARKKNR